MRGVSYWEFFFTVVGDFETLISKQKNSKETSRQLLPILVSIPHYKTINNGFPNKVIEAICNLLFVYWQTQSC